LSPFVFYVVAQGLRELGAFGADPDSAGLADGLDNLELFVVMVMALIGWELGVVGGAAHAAIRRRGE